MSIISLDISCYPTGVSFNDEFFEMSGEAWTNIYTILSGYISNGNYSDNYIFNIFLYFLASVTSPPVGTKPSTSPLFSLTVYASSSELFITYEFSHGNVDSATYCFITDEFIYNYDSRGKYIDSVKDRMNTIEKSRETRESEGKTKDSRDDYDSWIIITEILFSFWVLSSGGKTKADQDLTNLLISKYTTLSSTCNTTNTVVIIVLIVLILIVALMLFYKNDLIEGDKND